MADRRVKLAVSTRTYDEDGNFVKSGRKIIERFTLSRICKLTNSGMLTAILKARFENFRKELADVADFTEAVDWELVYPKS